MTRYVKNIFNAGEISPKVYGRSDIDKWQAGEKTMLNILPLPQGGFVRRPGFQHLVSANTSNDAIRLIPFVFSTTQAYVLEFGDEYLRFMTSDGQVYTPDADTVLLMHFNGENYEAIFTDDSPSAHTVTRAGNVFIWGDTWKFGSGCCWFDGSPPLDHLIVPDHADFNFGTAAFNIEAWVRFEGQLTAPYTRQGIISQRDADNDMWALYWDDGYIKFWASNNGDTVMNLAAAWTPTLGEWNHIEIIRGWGGDADTFSLNVGGSSRDSDTTDSWATNVMPDLAANVLIGVYTYDGNTNIFKGYMDELRVSTTSRWTANHALRTSEYPDADNSGTLLELATSYNSSDVAFLQYAQSYDTLYLTHQNHAPARLLRTGAAAWNIADITFTDAPAEWSAGNGYPRSCCLYQDRLCLAGSTKFPSRFWASKTGNHSIMTTGANNDDAMILNLLSGTSDTIFWMVGADKIVCGLDSGIHTVAAATGSNTALTPSNKDNKRVSYFGSAEVMPIKLGDIIIHAGNPASKVREVRYEFASDSYRSTELTVLSSHLVDSFQIKEFAYQQAPNEIVWCRRSDGNMLALTYMEEQNVVAWSQHHIGMNNISSMVASVASIPGATESELFAAIHYPHNVASTVTYIEKLSSFAETTIGNSLYMDSSLSYSGSEISVANASHLNGQEAIYVTASNNNSPVGPVNIVAGNNLNLAQNVTEVIFGRQYTSEMETLPVSMMASEQGGPVDLFKTQRITDLSVLCRNSAGGNYGPNTDNLTELFANNAYKNGIVENLSVRGNFDPSSSLVIQTKDPLPLNIDAIGIEVE